MDYPRRRVVITGMGIVSPLGNTPEKLWHALAAGTSGVGLAEHIRIEPSIPTRFTAEAREFVGTIDDFGPLEGDKKKAIRKGLKLMCRETQMGVASGQRALDHAGWGGGGYDSERSGVTFGSDYMMSEPVDFEEGMRRCVSEGKFAFTRWGGEGMPHVTPLWLLKYLPNMPASHLAIYNDLRGPSNSQTMREAASNLAIGEAYRTIARGDAEMMLAGATGTRIHPMKFVHSLLQEQIAGNGVEPAQASRPFDLHRTGMVLGEGAGAIVMEELKFAQSRGAKIYGELIGFSSSTAANRQGVANRKQALINAIQAAIKDAGLKLAEIGHIHAHGLSTKSSDAEEAQAIHEVLGELATKIPVVAAKSNFGNLGAGSGAVELVASAFALEHGHLFPTLNYESADPACPIHVNVDSQTPAGNTFLNLSITPQGQAAVLVVRKP